MLRYILAVLLLISFPFFSHAGEKKINFEISTKLLSSSAVYKTVADVKQLLEQSFGGWDVTLNQEGADVNISLSLTKQPEISTARDFPSSIFYPVHFYNLKSEPSKGGSALVISSPSEIGLVFGLYGLLQEKLGFRFYHPKDTYIPRHIRWPLPKRFSLTAEPRFEKRGFHLHTMHPMELTEQLHSDMDGTALGDIEQYIDWLVRNGQNVMQFWLLRTVDREKWPEYAKQYVNYAKSRGVLTGAVISLSTLQQKAFQTINLLNPLQSYRKQIDENLSWLMQVPFDFISIDFTMGEYLPDLSQVMPSYKEYLIQRIKHRYGVNVMENTHVIKREHLQSPPCTGKSIHSVMFYSLTEENAPVYGNENQKFMFDMMQEAKNERETWYWPESSYWVTFDTSVPLFLLPYLESRYSDMIKIGSEGIDGHVTFTSGWEWGYWVIDYSIARWSWKYIHDGSEKETSPLCAISELFGAESAPLFERALHLQEQYLKDKKMISLLSAKTPFEELPWPFNKSFQPTGDYSMLRASVPYLGQKDRDMIEEDALLLEKFYKELDSITNKLKEIPKAGNPVIDRLRAEIADSLEITALRARHRQYTLLAGAFRNYNLKDSSRFYLENLLKEAERTRRKAMSIVIQMEHEYRYPVALIARKLHSHTAYDFGYLYPVSDLFFWQREEQQAMGSRFDAFYMNIWSFWDTLGLDGLFK